MLDGNTTHVQFQLRCLAISTTLTIQHIKRTVKSFAITFCSAMAAVQHCTGRHSAANWLPKRFCDRATVGVHAERRCVGDRAGSIWSRVRAMLRWSQRHGSVKSRTLSARHSAHRSRPAVEQPPEQSSYRPGEHMLVAARRPHRRVHAAGQRGTHGSAAVCLMRDPNMVVRR